LQPFGLQLNLKAFSPLVRTGLKILYSDVKEDSFLYDRHHVSCSTGFMQDEKVESMFSKLNKLLGWHGFHPLSHHPNPSQQLVMHL
jgi:hypothetical protein